MAGRVGAAVLNKYFGKKPGQTLAEFARELKDLTDTDFAALVGGIEDGTYDYAI